MEAELRKYFKLHDIDIDVDDDMLTADIGVVKGYDSNKVQEVLTSFCKEIDFEGRVSVINTDWGKGETRLTIQFYKSEHWEGFEIEFI